MALGSRTRVKPPTGFTAVLNTGNPARIDLAWTAVPNAFRVSAYELDHSIDGQNWTNIASSTAVTKADTGLTAGTTYRYRIRTLDANGHYSSYVTASCGTPAKPTRRIVTGHWTAILESQHTASGVPSAAAVTGVGAYVVRYNLGDLDTGNGGTYVHTQFDKDLSQCAALGIMMFAMIVQRTFDGQGTNDPTNPMPSDLQAYSDLFTTSAAGTPHSGIQGWRWAPIVKDREQRTIQHFGARYNVVGGARYDLRTAFAGFAFQESSTGGVAGGTPAIYTAGNYTGKDKYDKANMKQALKDESDMVTDGCPEARGAHYLNFISGGNTADIGEVAAYITANGGYVGGPDLVTGVASGNGNTNSNIVNNCYPVYADVQNGTNLTSTVANPFTMPFKGRTFCAIQNGEWNGSGVGDAAVSMTNLYNMATSSNTYTTLGAQNHTSDSGLHLKAMVPDYHTSGSTLTYQAMVSIMAAHPDITVGSTPEWDTADATAASGFDYYIGPTGSNTNPGTLASPWAITALNTKRATYTGKTVGLLDGTYSLFATLNDGSHIDVDTWALDVDGGAAGAPTVIAAVNPRLAILTGKSGTTYGNANGTPLLGHSGGTTHRGYVTFDGLKIIGCSRMGIRIGIYGVGTQIAGITVKNCEFTDFKGTALGAGLNLEQVEYNNCTGHLHQNNYHHDNIGYAAGSSDHFSSTLQWLSDRGTYEYNTIENSASIYAKENGQFGTTIRYNYIDVSALTDANADAIIDFNGYSGSSSTTTSVHHNIMVGAKGWDGLDVLDDSEYSRDLVTFYNNTIVAKASAASRGFKIKAAAGNGSIYNNIVRDEATGDHCGPAYNVNIDGICNYNCYYSSAGDLKLSSYASVGATSRDTVSTIAAFRTATGAEAASIVTDPSFVGTGTRSAKYVLAGASPCVGTGKSNGLVGGAACDMGAWGNSPPTRIGCDF